MSGCLSTVTVVTGAGHSLRASTDVFVPSACDAFAHKRTQESLDIDGALHTTYKDEK